MSQGTPCTLTFSNSEQHLVAQVYLCQLIQSSGENLLLCQGASTGVNFPKLCGPALYNSSFHALEMDHTCRA